MFAYMYVYTVNNTNFCVGHGWGPIATGCELHLYTYRYMWMYDTIYIYVY